MNVDKTPSVDWTIHFVQCLTAVSYYCALYCNYRIELNVGRKCAITVSSATADIEDRNATNVLSTHTGMSTWNNDMHKYLLSIVK